MEQRQGAHWISAARQLPCRHWHSGVTSLYSQRTSSFHLSWSSSLSPFPWFSPPPIQSSSLVSILHYPYSFSSTRLHCVLKLERVALLCCMDFLFIYSFSYFLRLFVCEDDSMTWNCSIIMRIRRAKEWDKKFVFSNNRVVPFKIF